MRLERWEPYILPDVWDDSIENPDERLEASLSTAAKNRNTVTTTTFSDDSSTAIPRLIRTWLESRNFEPQRIPFAVATLLFILRGNDDLQKALLCFFGACRNQRDITSTYFLDLYAIADRIHLFIGALSAHSEKNGHDWRQLERLYQGLNPAGINFAKNKEHMQSLRNELEQKIMDLKPGTLEEFQKYFPEFQQMYENFDHRTMQFLVARMAAIISELFCFLHGPEHDHPELLLISNLTSDPLFLIAWSSCLSLEDSKKLTSMPLTKKFIKAPTQRQILEVLRRAVGLDFQFDAEQKLMLAASDSRRVLLLSTLIAFGEKTLVDYSFLGINVNEILQSTKNECLKAAKQSIYTSGKKRVQSTPSNLISTHPDTKAELSHPNKRRVLNKSVALPEDDFRCNKQF